MTLGREGVVRPPDDGIMHDALPTIIGLESITDDTEKCMDLSMMSASELASELGARVRRERLRQNMTQQTLAARAGVSRLTVTRMEANGEAALLTNFLSVLAALRRTAELEGLLAPPVAETIDQFVDAHPARRRGRR